MYQRFRKRTGAFCAVALSSALLFAGCTSSSPEEGGSSSLAAAIALVVPLTGDAALEGENAVNAATLAVEQIEKDGGPTIKIDPLDDQADPTTATNIASQVVDKYADGTYTAVVGLAHSDLALAAAPVLDAAGVPTIGTTPSNPSISDQGWTNWLRMVQSDKSQANQLTAFAVNNLGKKKVAILYANNDYGVGIMNYQIDALKTLGAELTVTETYTPSEDTDFTTQLTNIKNSGADSVILNTGYTEGGLIKRQAEQLGMGGIAFVGSGNNLYQDFIDLAGNSANGSYILTSFDSFSTDPLTSSFVTEYQTRFGSLPAEGAFSTYDAVLAIASALGDGATKNNLIASLKSTGFTGAGGAYSWADNGDVSDKTMAVIKVTDGKFVSAGESVDMSGLN